MAFVTNSTFSLLTSKIGQLISVDFDDSLEFYSTNIFSDKRTYFLFNKLELSKLFTAKSILQDEKKFINLYFSELNIKEDNKLYVFSKGGKYKFHLYEDCESLNKDFVDFRVPEEIRDVGDDAINDFRNWFVRNNFKDRYLQNFENFVDNKELDKYVISLYNNLFTSKYNIKKLPNEYVFATEMKSSGKTEIKQSLQLNELLSFIDFSMSKRDILTNKGDVIKRLTRYDWMLEKDKSQIESTISEKIHPDFIKNYGYNKLLNLWREHKEIKETVYEKLIDYFKTIYKFDEKTFENIDLEAMGMAKCKYCEKRNS